LSTLVQLSKNEIDRSYVKNSFMTILDDEFTIRNISDTIDLSVTFRGAAGVTFQPSVISLPKNSEQRITVHFSPVEINKLANGVNVVRAILDITSNTPITTPTPPIEQPPTPPTSTIPLNAWKEQRYHGSPMGDDSTPLATIFSRAPVLTQTVSRINYSGNNIPAPTTVRWEGRFTFDAAPYEFAITTDDGMRMWIDGTLIFDEWRMQGTPTFTRVVNMTAGEHDLRVEYFNGTNVGAAAVSFYKVVNSGSPSSIGGGGSSGGVFGAGSRVQEAE